MCFPVKSTDLESIRKNKGGRRNMLRAYKTEIHPTEEQKRIINRTIGTCRFVYNFYLAHNKEVYEKENRFVSANEFSKWINNELVPNNFAYKWIKEVSSKAVKQSIINGEKAYRRFFKGLSKFPKFKKKKNQDVKMYFVKTDAKTVITCERHRIKIPTLGWVRIKEKGYVPTKAMIKSGTVSCKAGRYYISVLVEEELKINNAQEQTEGIGIDLGLKEFAVVSNGLTKKNINKTPIVKKVEKKLKREQRKLSRKYESLKERKKTEKGEATRQNIQKQILVVQKLHQKLDNLRTDYINKTVNEIIKQKPSFITIEDLNILGMMKNKHLAKAVAQQKFNEFRSKLISKAKLHNIEIKIVDRWYPSSKICSCCGELNTKLKLKDRIFKCSCGLVLDRDINASVNLANATEYKIA